MLLTLSRICFNSSSSPVLLPASLEHWRGLQYSRQQAKWTLWNVKDDLPEMLSALPRQTAASSARARGLCLSPIHENPSYGNTVLDIDSSWPQLCSKPHILVWGNQVCHTKCIFYLWCNGPDGRWNDSESWCERQRESKHCWGELGVGERR